MLVKKISFTFAVFLLFTHIAYAEEALLQLANSIFSPLPDSMPAAENDTPEQIALGNKLYFEKALSANYSQSCNTCHNLLNQKFGVDNLRKSLGALGHIGNRNTPSTVNAGFQFALFWDGRVADLTEQAKSPILNPLEMALPSETEAVRRLYELGYEALFSSAFSSTDSPITFNNIAHALAAFQRTLISKDRFDDYLKGNVNALTRQEKTGMKQFIQSGCIGCHSGSLLGGGMMQKLGIVNPYPNTDDKGLAEVTGNPADNFMFKVPPLRGVGQTAPYFHDGATISLEDVVRDTAWHQMGTRLSEDEVINISAFLRTLDNTRNLISDN